MIFPYFPMIFPYFPIWNFHLKNQMVFPASNQIQSHLRHPKELLESLEEVRCHGVLSSWLAHGMIPGEITWIWNMGNSMEIYHIYSLFTWDNSFSSWTYDKWRFLHRIIRYVDIVCSGLHPIGSGILSQAVSRHSRQTAEVETIARYSEGLVTKLAIKPYQT